MSAILDLLVVVVIIAFVVTSTKQGFVKSALGFVGYVAAFFIAKAYSASLGLVLSAKYVTPFLYNKVAEQIGSITNHTGNADTIVKSVDIPKLVSDAPDAFKYMLSAYGSSIETIKQTVGNQVAKTTSEINKYIIDAIVSSAAKIVSESLAFILIFIGCIIAVKLLIIILDSFSKLPVLSTFNTVGGFGIGVLKGCIVAIAIATAIAAISPYIASENKPLISDQTVQSTIVFKHLDFSSMMLGTAENKN